MFYPQKPIPNVKRVLVVASGKGGVGKTSTAVNLALALTQLGLRVGIFDADLYGPNVPIMLGVRRRKRGSGYVPIARAQKDPYIPTLDRFGLKVMSIGLIMGDAQSVTPDPTFAGQIIRQTIMDVKWGNLDILLIDLPPGTGDPQQTLLRTLTIDGAVLVTTPQDLSMMDTGRSLSHFEKAKIPMLGYVENMSYLICPCCGEAIEVFARSERSWILQNKEIPCLGSVPLDKEISAGIHAEHPLVASNSDSPSAQIYLSIAKKLVTL